MKLLLEAWKGYLASTKPIPQQDPNYPEEEEDVYDIDEPQETIEDLETKYFGKSKNSLYKICELLLENYNQNSYDNYQLDRFAKVLGKNVGLNIKFMGSGAYRTTYAIGNDLVMKIASDMSDPYTTDMNKNDHKLGTDSEIGNIFPRAYLHGGNFEWVLLERVTPINKNHEAAKYFENPILPPVDQLSESEKNDYFNLVILSLEENNRGRFYNLIHHSSISKKYPPKESIPTLDDVRQNMLKNSHTYRNLYKAVKKYGIDTSEIRFQNIGYGSDDRFVVLDSSIF